MAIEKSKRILFAAPSAYTLSGLATWLDYLLPGLEKSGWDVHLGLVAGPRHHRPKTYLQQHAVSNVIEIDCRSSTPVGRVRAVTEAINELSPRIVASVNIPDALRATAIARNGGANIRAVATCHGIQEDLFADMQLLSRELDAVVCSNRLACRLASRLGTIPKNRIFHSAYGTRVPRSLPDGKPKKPFKIGYSGRLEQPQKRAHDVLEIADALRRRSCSFEMIVAGNGPEHAALQKSITAKQLENHVKLIGFVSPDEIEDRLYREVDALLVTSEWETGPIVIWESMAAGKPVVSSRYIGSGREGILQHGENCLLFSIGDAEQAAEQLQTLIADEDLHAKIRECAFATVTQSLSCEASIANWSAILSSIVSEPPIHGGMKLENIPMSPGRLTRLLGEEKASSLRQLVGRIPPDGGPGGEWPHTIQGSTMPTKEFFSLAQDLDKTSSSLLTP